MSSIFTNTYTMFFMKRNSVATYFGKRLSEIRRQRGFSQRSLAKMVGTSGRMIAHYEGETNYIPAHLLEPLCKALQISTDELFGLKPCKRNVTPKEFFLWKRFKKVEGLSVRDKKALFRLLNSLLQKDQHSTASQKSNSQTKNK